jgi:hypothetical protein
LPAFTGNRKVIYHLQYHRKQEVNLSPSVSVVSITMKMESTGVVAAVVIFATLMASCAAQGNQ